MMYSSQNFIRAPRGSKLHCKGWVQEAARRMLMNNLDPEVAELPEELIVYGGRGKAARNPEAYGKIIRALENLENDETLLVQSGKAVAVLPSHIHAPRVIIANSNLVPHWSHWDYFNEMEKKGLMMYGQMTAGSWIYIGTQGILQGTFETFMAAAKKHFSSDLRGHLVVSAGLGGMGGAQPLAVKMANGVFLGAEVDPSKIERRIKTAYLDCSTKDIEKGIAWAMDAVAKKKELSIGVECNAVDLLEALLKSNYTPSLITDQTSAHDPLTGYVPVGFTVEEAASLRKENPELYTKKAIESIGEHVKKILAFQKRGSHAFDYGNNIRTYAKKAGVANAFDYPGFVPAYIRPLFCEGSGPFRWVALSGDPKDIEVTDEAILEAVPENENVKIWIEKARQHVSFQGLPARICWLKYGERKKVGLLFNRLVREGKVSAPIVIGRDHLDAGSVASPYRETEAMKDGSDAVSDWPLLNALINTAGGASWVSFHNGGGVGIGYSQHAGMVIVADGSDIAEKNLSIVLNNDPAMGVIRHADAGYEEAKEFSLKENIHIPDLQ